MLGGFEWICGVRLVNGNELLKIRAKLLGKHLVVDDRVTSRIDKVLDTCSLRIIFFGCHRLECDIGDGTELTARTEFTEATTELFRSKLPAVPLMIRADKPLPLFIESVNSYLQFVILEGGSKVAPVEPLIVVEISGIE